MATTIRLIPPGVCGYDFKRPRRRRRMTKAEWFRKSGVWYVASDNGCWDWLYAKTGGAPNQRGYGLIGIGGKRRLAHRVVFELFRHSIPEGHCIDHICRNRGCVNPGHLQLASPGVNVLLGTSPSAMNLGQTHCRNGHEYTPENTSVAANGWRRCKTCRAAEAGRRRTKDLTSQSNP